MNSSLACWVAMRGTGFFYIPKAQAETLPYLLEFLTWFLHDSLWCG